jgi:hypothetical protein
VMTSDLLTAEPLKRVLARRYDLGHRTKGRC